MIFQALVAKAVRAFIFSFIKIAMDTTMFIGGDRL